MYYTTLEYYKKIFESTKREFAFDAENLEEYAEWKERLRKRLRDIAGIDRCISCEPVHNSLYAEEIGGFQAEYHTLETEPGVIMPFYMIRPEMQKNMPVLIIPHGHGSGKEKVPVQQGDFIKDALEDGFLVVCPDERGSGDRREYTQQGEEPERIRLNSHRELMQVGINFGRTVIGTAVWDLMRLADWLQSLPETGEFLACAGMSEGGQQTLWFAPRPFFVESGEKDPLSGKSGIGNVISQLDVTRKAYRLFEAEDKIVHSVHPGGHKWIGKGMRDFLQKSRFVKG